MAVELTFELQLLSHYHVGSGFAGEIDSFLLRDGDGVPAIRGTTLAGLLRDGLERLLQMPAVRQRYGEGARHPLGGGYCSSGASCPVCRLFGTPAGPGLWKISSARPGGLERPAMEIKDRFAAVHRVRINYAARRSQPRSLFSLERGDRRLAFVFTAQSAAGREVNVEDVALLVAAARNVRHLGSSRRRGWGECVIGLRGIQGVEDAGFPAEPAKVQEHFWERILAFCAGEIERDVLLTPVNRAVENKRSLPDPVSLLKEALRQPEEPQVIRLLARAAEPLVLACRAEAGNMFESVQAVPGRAIFGSLIRRAAEQVGDSLLPDLIKELFFTGAVVLSPLWPCLKKDTLVFPGLPVPRDTGMCKYFSGYNGHDKEERGLFLLASIDGPGDEYCPQCYGIYELRDSKVETPLVAGTGFVAVHEKPRKIEITLAPEMHVSIDNGTGRALPRQLFGYTALPAGTCFWGEICFRSRAVWECFAKIFNLGEDRAFSLKVGKAAGRGYGTLRLHAGRLQRAEEREGFNSPLRERVKEGEERIRFTFISDTVFVDQWGRYCCEPDQRWLEKILGFPVEVEDEDVFVCATERDGFNRLWGLPDQRKVIIQAGSTWRLKVPGGVKKEMLDRMCRLEAAGVGEYRWEGYGRVAFNLLEEKIQLPKTGVSLPEELLTELLTDTTDHFMRRDSAWSREVNELLDKRLDEVVKEWPGGERKQLALLARWLYRQRHCPVEELEEKLSSMGWPSENIIKYLKDYCDPGRENKIWPPGKGQDRLKRLQELLEELAGKSRNSCEFTRAVEALAGRLAGIGADVKEEV
ncbi:CRISPR-associated protein Csx10 [Desulforamulus putei DSM 12395]|uniref:CRISPR-associated protein Csx10 n=1 Tax=Desulforamulus putei DSM 12395 TaxID=1121429 RepID=A0A1M4SH69_9FIRM|nr:RAMP superfamily CRISPR-associated protein [Desulforamulus putei]SHE31512.1 CRISPR-associated protein Csx10 [Desulforamulus putei DSM 12395]